MATRDKLSNLPDSVSSFAKYHQTLLTHILKPHQKLWLSHILKGNTFILGARQIGKSFLVAYAAILLAAGYRDKDTNLPPTDVIVISADQKKAINIIKEVNNHLKALGYAVEDITHDTQGGIQTAVLKNGKKIQAVTGLSRSLQGYSGHVIVDEFSLTEADPEEIMAQVFAVTSSKNHLRAIICTNADKKGSFVDSFIHDQSPYWQGRRESWHVFNTTIWDVYPDLNEKLRTVRKNITVETWNRFFENRFVSGQSTWFDEGKVRSALKVDDDRDGNIWLCVDPGFSATGNPTGVVVCKVKDDHIHVIESQRWWAVPELEQVDMIKTLFKKYDADKLFLDVGVGGMLMKQKLEAHLLIQAVHVTNKTTQQSLLKLKSLLDDGRLTFDPDSCWDLRDDLLSIEADNKGNYVAPQVPHKTGGKTHADCAFALSYLVPYIGQGVGQSRLEILNVKDNLSSFFGQMSWDGGL